MRAQDLKNSILQLAISGKLVKQDPNDEPASVLFSRIQAEKKRLVALGKIKAGKPAEKIGRITPPFEIPDSWLWVRLGDIANLYTGDSIPELVKSSKYTGLKDGYDYIGTKDVGFDNSISYNNGVRIPHDEKSFKYSFANSILLCIEGGSAGRKIGLLDKQVCFGNKLCSITAIEFDFLYLYYFLQSDFFRQIFNGQNSGIIGGVSIKKLNDLVLPLPPVSEQKRIVAKIQEILPLISRYATAADTLARIKSSLPDDLRRAILQFAIQGKLVPQNPADEPASVLLDKIRAERATRVKAGKIKPSKLPKLNEQFIPPFPIPNSWAWVRFGEVCNYGECENVESARIGKNDWILDLEDIEKDSGRLLVRKNKSQVESVSTKHRFTTGEVLYSKLRPYLNKVIIADTNGFCTSEILPLHFGKHIFNKYAQMFLMSPHFVEYANKCSYGTKMPRLGTQDGKAALFALPPLAEQKRIVEKVEELNGLVDKLPQFLA
jgi:type I restriction enzyme S subunit